MIIELIGPPGSGKTFLATAMRDYLRRQGFDAVLQAEAERSLGMGSRFLTAIVLAVNVTLFFLRYPRLVLGVILRQFSRPISIRQSLWLVRSFLQAGSRQVAFSRLRSYQKKVIISDGGLAHFSVSLFTSELERPDRVEVFDYVRTIPSSDLIIHVKTSLNVCLRRLKSRELPRRVAGKDWETIKSFVSNQNDTVDLIGSAAKRLGQSIVYVSNQGTRKEAIRKIPSLCRKVDFPFGVRENRFLGVLAKTGLSHSKKN